MIAILASLLLPALASARRTANQVVCLNNLKQIGVSARLALDEDSRESLAESGFLDWQERETGASQTWICPDAPAKTKSRANINFEYGNYESELGAARHAWKLKGWRGRFYTRAPAKYGHDYPDGERNSSYLANAWITAAADILEGEYFGQFITQDNFFVQESNIVQPSRTPLITDGIYFAGFPALHDYHIAWDVTTGAATINPRTSSAGSMNFLTIARHRMSGSPPRGMQSGPLPGAVDMLYFDGHAELVPLSRRWDQSWRRGYDGPTMKVN